MGIDNECWVSKYLKLSTLEYLKIIKIVGYITSVNITCCLDENVHAPAVSVSMSVVLKLLYSWHISVIRFWFRGTLELEDPYVQ